MAARRVRAKRRRGGEPVEASVRLKQIERKLEAVKLLSDLHMMYVNCWMLYLGAASKGESANQSALSRLKRLGDEANQIITWIREASSAVADVYGVADGARTAGELQKLNKSLDVARTGWDRLVRILAERFAELKTIGVDPPPYKRQPLLSETLVQSLTAGIRTNLEAAKSGDEAARIRLIDWYQQSEATKRSARWPLPPE